MFGLRKTKRLEGVGFWENKSAKNLDEEYRSYWDKKREKHLTTNTVKPPAIDYVPSGELSRRLENYFEWRRKRGHKNVHTLENYDHVDVIEARFFEEFRQIWGCYPYDWEPGSSF